MKTQAHSITYLPEKVTEVDDTYVMIDHDNALEQVLSNISDKHEMSIAKRIFAFNVYSTVFVQCLITLITLYVSKMDGFLKDNGVSQWWALVSSVLSLTGLACQFNTPNLNIVLAAMSVSGFAYINGTLCCLLPVQAIVMCMGTIGMFVVSTFSSEVFHNIRFGQWLVLGFINMVGLTHFVYPFASASAMAISSALALAFGGYIVLVAFANMPKLPISKVELSSEFYSALCSVNGLFLALYVLFTFYF